MTLSHPDSWQHHQVREDTISTNPCIPPGNVVSEGSPTSSKCAADRKSDEPTTNDKDLNAKQHDHIPSTNRRGRKRSATNQDHPTRTGDQHLSPSQQSMKLQSDHTNYHPGNSQGQDYTGKKARIIPSHPTSAHLNVATALSPTAPMAQSPSTLTASDMNTERNQYHTTHSEQNQSQHHNTQDYNMTQDCWPPVDVGDTIPSSTTASPIGRVKRHLTTTSGTAEEPTTGPRYHPTINHQEQLPIKVLRLNNGKRRKVGDTAPNRDAPPPIIKENTSQMEPIQSHNLSGTYTNYEEDCILIGERQNDEPRQAIVRTNPTGIG